MSIVLPEPPHIDFIEQIESGTHCKPYLYHIGVGTKKNSIYYYYKIGNKYFYGLVKSIQKTEGKTTIRLRCRKSKNQPGCGFCFSVQRRRFFSSGPSRIWCYDVWNTRLAMNVIRNFWPEVSHIRTLKTVKMNKKTFLASDRNYDVLRVRNRRATSL